MEFVSLMHNHSQIKLFGQEILVAVPHHHPLIILANQLPWDKMLELIEYDIKQSSPLKRLHYGRKLKVRIHLGAYLLQKMKSLASIKRRHIKNMNLVVPFK